jgi:hypothetical protein
MNIRNRVKELRHVPASDLRPNPKNWRTHPTAQRDALRGILAEVGMADAVLARELPDGSLMLIDGHLRAETLGEGSVPVLVLDVNEAEADKLLATLDPVAAMAGKDAEQLAALLGQLKEQDDNLASLVWPDYIIEPLLSADWTPPDPGEEPTKDQGPKPKGEGVLHLSEEQREVVDAAIAKCRAFNEDDSLTDTQCVELICVEYLDK